MAKGFTVKTVPPKKAKAPEWDIDAIKGRMQGQEDCLLSPWTWMFVHVFEELCTTVF